MAKLSLKRLQCAALALLMLSAAACSNSGNGQQDPAVSSAGAETTAADPEAPVRRAPDPESESAEETPVRRSSGGRHAIAAPARKSAGALGSLASSGKRGKHELDRSRRISSSGTKKGRHEL